MLTGTHYWRGRYPQTFRRRRRRLRSCPLCGCDPATQYVGRLQTWLCATCQAVDRIRFLHRCAAAGEELPLVAAWARWELGRIAAVLERPRQ